jgi:hypothetical protein
MVAGAAAGRRARKKQRGRQGVAAANSHCSHGVGSGRMDNMQVQVGVRQLFCQHFGSLQHLIVTLPVTAMLLAASFFNWHENMDTSHGEDG